jgi:aspartate-semialdehyde dehydrogenase
VASLDILGNVIPAISGEEEKMESETQKILGTLERDDVSPHPMVVSATTTRVPVIDGHTESISIEFEQRPSLDDVRYALEGFRGRPQELELPSAPPAPVVYLDAADRPQPRLDVERGNGMTVSVALRPARFLALPWRRPRRALRAFSSEIGLRGCWTKLRCCGRRR